MGVTVRQGEEIVKEHQEKMETEASKKFDKKTMKDENGQYPVWMNQRQIKKKRAQNKKAKGQTKSTAQACEMVKDITLLCLDYFVRICCQGLRLIRVFNTSA